MSRTYHNLLTLEETTFKKNHPISITTFETYTAEETIKKIKQLSSLLKKDKSTHYIIHIKDPYVCLIAFLAVNNIEKTAIFYPNLNECNADHLKKYSPKVLVSEVQKSQFESIDILQENTQLGIEEVWKVKNCPILFHTSGSTGIPKTQLKTVEKLALEIDHLHKRFKEHTKNRTYLSTVSPLHIYGFLFSLLWPLCEELPFYSETILGKETLLPLLKTKKTVLISSPAFLKRVPSLINETEKHAPFIISSGGKLSKDAITTIEETLSSDLVDILGSTETGGIAFRYPLKEEVFQKFEFVKISRTKEGELYVEEGYLNPGDAPHGTGDCIVWEEEGERFLLKDRLDRMVKIEEKRISLAEIEDQLKQHPDIKEVYALKLEFKKEEIGVLVVLTENGKNKLHQNGKRELDQQFRRYLSGYFESVVSPRRYRYLEAIETNAQGKYDKERLKGYFL